jgi:hypothetical protein
MAKAETKRVLHAMILNTDDRLENIKANVDDDNSTSEMIRVEN